MTTQPGDQFGHVAVLPPIRTLQSPSVVRVFDRIRRALDDDDTYAEFCWFAREYPRCYRFHLDDGADFRLSSVHRSMTRLHSQLVLMAQGSPSSFEVSSSNRDVHQVYWDFESFLSEISVALDLLARIAGPAFNDETPLSFNRFCKRTAGTRLTEIFQAAERRWVRRMKDYRDCFFHYTPVDTLLMVVLRRYPDGWELRAKLPINPNVREILGFRFSRRVELFRYAVSVHRHMTALDRAVGREIWRLFRREEFPRRKDKLFFVGQRSR